MQGIHHSKLNHEIKIKVTFYVYISETLLVIFFIYEIKLYVPFLDKSCRMTAAKTKAAIFTNMAEIFNALIKCISEYSTCAQ